MGISNFNSWLKTEYSECFRSNRTKTNKVIVDIYDHIYIDLNFILHSVIFSSSNQRIFLTSLFDKIDSILNCHMATKTITIAIDGPGPLSKIDLQRKRRESKQCENNTGISPLVLTPGTMFIDSLENHLKSYIKSREKRFLFRKIKFILLPASQPDEGEIKLLKEIYKNNKNDSSSTHLVVGNDADLVVMTIALGDVDNIYVLLKDMSCYRLFDIDKFLLCHSKKYMCIQNYHEYLADQYRIRSDIAAVSVMMGNDYIPRTAYVKFDKIWESYKVTKENIPNSFLMIDNRFDTLFFEKFLENLIKKISKNFIRQPKYKNSEIKNYLEGVLWCIDMYRNGVCQKYDFKILSNNKPHPVDILDFIKKNNIYCIKPPLSDFKPLDPRVCGVILLPKRALNLMPDKIKNIATKYLIKLYEKEDCKVCEKSKNELSIYNKKIYSSRKSLQDNESVEKEEEIEKNIKELQYKINELNKKYKEHSNTHPELDIKEVCDIMAKRL